MIPAIYCTFIQNEELFEERHFAELLAADSIRGIVALKCFFTEVRWSVRKSRTKKEETGIKQGNLPNKEVGKEDLPQQTYVCQDKTRLLW